MDHKTQLKISAALMAATPIVMWLSVTAAAYMVIGSVALFMISSTTYMAANLTDMVEVAYHRYRYFRHGHMADKLYEP